ncbi:MAG: PAS domain S-box protein [Candidatus Hydrogenedentes bacterium]|nr:PAS domain S-box protein [Candidatus Hydrogenedentota bacterium]
MSTVSFRKHAGTKSFRRSYSVLLLVAACIAVLLVLTLSYFERYEMLKRANEMNYNAARLVAEVVGDEFNGITRHAEGFSRNSTILRGIAENDLAALDRPLRNFVNSSRRISRVYVADINGTLLRDYPQDPSVHGQNYAKRDWFVHASKMEKPYISEVYQRVALGKPHVAAIAAPIVADDGSRVGYLVCQIEVAKFWAWLSAIHPAPEGTLLLIDQSGTVFGAQAKGVQTVEASPLLEELIKRSDGVSHKILDPVRKVESFACAVQIPGLDWRVAFLMPMSVVMRPMADHYMTIGISFGFCYAGIALMGFVWLRSVHKTQEIREQAEAALRKSHDQLELRVEQRTEELREAYTSLESEMAERAKAVDQLSSSEAQYRLLFQSNPDPMLVYDIETLEIVLVNDMALDTFGYSREEFLTMTIEDPCGPDSLERLRKTVRELKGVIRRPGEFDMVHKNGSIIVIDSTTHDIELFGRQCRLTMLRDVTEKKKAEEALRLSDIRYRSSLELAPVGIMIHRDGVLRFANSAYAQMMGAESTEELLGRNVWDDIPKEFMPIVQARFSEVKAKREALPPLEEQILRYDGTRIDVEISVGPTEYEGEESYIVVIRDITERKRSEEALRTSDERFRIVSKATNDAVWDWDIVTNTVWWGDGAKTLFGYASGEMPTTSETWMDKIHPEDRDRVIAGMAEAFASGGPLWSDEYRYVRADGAIVTVFDRAYIIRDDEGNPIRVIGAMADVSERKRLQAQLSQAQKLESVGRLAGGVAHDFNNLLTIVIGNAEFALSRLREEDPVRNEVNEIMTAAQRAADLTRQLLAFARKQIIEPRIVNVNSLVLGLEKMMHRLIGEDVVLTTMPDDRAALIKVDPGQMEQVLLNLAINARDAMPDGGHLTIEISSTDFAESHSHHGVDMEPGDYVLISVSDTGTGMDSNTLSQAFEPFFTTKEIGKGTGLGLAMCYGIVRQAGGHIWAYSELGSGTTFRIYLPRASQSGMQVGTHAALPEANGSETILVVEDEAKVREMVQKTLAAKGFKVLAAEDADDALIAARKYGGKIDLLLTDVVMPKVSGKELARELTKIRMDLKVLFMSGYAEDAIARHGILDEGVQFLSKPFTPQTLATKVRAALDANNIAPERTTEQSVTSSPK